MEEKKQKSFYSLAKYPSYEILMEGQLASAGAHQAKFIEKLKKNNKYIKHQFLALKFVFAFLFVFLPLLPLVTYFQIQDSIGLGIYSINSIVFVSSLVFIIFFGMTLLYMLMFGMVSTGSFMSGNAFKWLQTLPFSKKNLKKIGLMTLFRNLDIPLIILIAGFPIIMLISSQDILIFLISLAVSVVNVIFSFSILILIGEKMRYLFSESKVGSKKASFIRTITMLGYFIIMFGTSFIFSLGISTVDTLFNTFKYTEPPFVLSLILSLIPFLVAPAFLVSLSSIQFQAHPILILTTLTGFALSVVLTWAIFKVAQRALRSAISTEIKTEKIEKKEIQFEIKAASPIKAYLRKDIVSSTRDIQSFMFIFFPIFYPLIMILTMTGLFNEITISIETILIVWSIILLVYLFIPIMLIVGFLNLEESGSSTLASLPLVPRDQAKAKIILMISIQGISLIITSIVLTLLLESVIVIVLLLITLPIAWTLLIFMFVLKIKFFGKMKYKYIIEELHKENKILKWILMVLSSFGLYMVILITGNILIYIFGITTGLIVLGVIGLLGLTLMVFIFNRMFPKVEKITEYKTGGFLREHVNTSTFIVLLLFFIFSFFPLFVQVPFIPLLSQVSFTTYLFINFFLEMAFFGLLWFITVPYGLKLPNGKESFNQFSSSIGLNKVKPLWKNILIGVAATGILLLSVLFIGMWFGTYVFNPDLLFSPPINIFNLGWFNLIYMLRPGIWEEVAFRGVILNLQKKKYKQWAVVLINGIIFGLFHLTNLISVPNSLDVYLQAFYAGCFGIALSYMYIKTKSLLPCILTHYLFNAFSILFIPYIDPYTNPVNYVLFQILGAGIVPAILIVLMVYLIFRNKNSRL